MTNEILSSSVLPISQDIKLLRDNETIPNVSPLEISPQIKTRSDMKHVFIPSLKKEMKSF
jgi:hypothetical protein